jgi:hypothetical protein
MAGPHRHRADDQCQRTATLQHAVDGLGPSCPSVQRKNGPKATSRYGPSATAGRSSQALDPPDVHDCFLLGCAAARRKHAGVKVQTNRLPEQISKADGKHAKAAVGIRKRPFPSRPASCVRTASSCGEYAGRPQ